MTVQIGSLLRSLGLIVTSPSTAELARAVLPILTPDHFIRGHRITTTGEATAPGASAQVAAFTALEDDFYMIDGIVSIFATLAAWRRVDIQLMEATLASALWIIRTSFGPSAATPPNVTFGPYIFYMRANERFRVITVEAWGVGEIVWSAINVKRLYAGPN